MKNITSLVAGSLMSCLASTLQAADLDQINVTATRTAQTEDASLASVSVITRQDIERLQAHSIQDLLRDLPGITLSNNGGAGKTTSLFMRGSESDHLLVLVDGIRVGSATLGTAAIQDLPVAQIERIEIVRGPRSSLYGSEAIGGVIQIFTRRGGGELKHNFALELGSHASRRGVIGFSGGGERSWYSLNLALRQTDGIDACVNRADAGCYASEPDEDGYRNESGSLRGGYRFDNGLEVDLHALLADGDNDFDGGFVNESDTRQRVLGGTLRYTPLAPWLLTLTAGRSWDESDNYKDGVFRTTFDTERDNLSLQNDIELASEQLLTLGYDYRKERVESTTDYLVDTRDNRGIFVQYQGGFLAQDLQISLRRDDNQAFGRHTTGGIAWGYAIDDQLRVRASYATAFKTPTFNELYYPGFGNADLNPEESTSLELGLTGAMAWGEWSLSAFRTRVEELIGFDAFFTPVNVDRATIRGIEMEYATDIGSWHTSAGLTLLDPRNSSGGVNDGHLLPRRPRRSLRVELDRDVGPYTLGATLFAEGARYDDLANTRELGGFGSLDLRASYRINSAWLLRGRCENLFDKRYETANFYNQSGRSFYLTLSYES